MSEIGKIPEITDVNFVKPVFENFEHIKPMEGMTFHEAQNFWYDFFTKEISVKTREVDVSKDVKESKEYFSTYEERLNQTPKEDSDRGIWEAERGESKFIPYDQEIKEILGKYGLDGIAYKDGIPDFSGVSESTVEIDHMTEIRPDNFRQCDEQCAEQWSKENRDGRTEWTPRDVAQWRKENGYSWHERNDMKTCDLVPAKINDYFGHLGGVSECRKRDSVENGGDFDE